MDFLQFVALSYNLNINHKVFLFIIATFLIYIE